MPKYIITYNGNYDEIEAETLQEANEIAYDAWREDVESECDSEVLEWTEENCDNYGFNYNDSDD